MYQLKPLSVRVERDRIKAASCIVGRMASGQPSHVMAQSPSMAIVLAAPFHMPLPCDFARGELQALQPKPQHTLALQDGVVHRAIPQACNPIVAYVQRRTSLNVKMPIGDTHALLELHVQVFVCACEVSV